MCIPPITWCIQWLRRNSFEEEDRLAAHAFAVAARDAGVQRIIYLSGLGSSSELSAHLRSRQEVGRILRESGVPTIEFRAAIVIGSGSASFEMIRALVEKLPVMITPRWVNTSTQPIAVEDVIAYLKQALDLEINGSRIIEIGGADQVTYLDLMKEYARQRGLHRSDDSRTSALSTVVEPLAGPCDACLCACGPRVSGQLAQRNDCDGSIGK